MDNHGLFLAMDISLAAIVPHKEAAIALAADRLAETTGMAYGDVKDALAHREALGSTALGKGIAMPHAVSRTCPRPALSLVSLASPVDFDAPDHRSVDVVLALIWPQNRVGDFVRFSLLANRILSDPTVLEAVRGTGAPGRIRSLFHARNCVLRSSEPLLVRTAGHVYGLPRP
ncbi:PTS sugar transporter subunit IIA [Rhizobium sp. TRM96647]|uniref:PTS sugar transporter subunit IIA n=1 Tax=unclassified Rhizobium TaxID=2613769 RepID=UPI0021E756FE|nr:MULTISPECIES: PTS sugar transporter subunit IIA [unclassified Rhizobium]MCV3737334.1 PTS sugar transporter subunit IIA [Rhizobium sp. TRM96647]MCV3759318.1 PTS sugar transporter subunit IIA [Rhizobium sp. TRM96650]